MATTPAPSVIRTAVKSSERALMSALVYLWDIGFREGDTEFLEPLALQAPRNPEDKTKLLPLAQVPFEKILDARPDDLLSRVTGITDMTIMFKARVSSKGPPKGSILEIERVQPGTEAWITWTQKLSVKDARDLCLLKKEATVNVWRIHCICMQKTPKGVAQLKDCGVPSMHVSCSESKSARSDLDSLLLYPITGHSETATYEILTKKQAAELKMKWQLARMSPEDAQSLANGFVTGTVLKVIYPEGIATQFCEVRDAPY